MAQFRIDPTNSVGPLTFGMDGEQVAEIVGTDSEPFRRTPDSTELVHAYDSAGLHLTFDSNSRLKHVTVFTPNEVLLGGVQLLGEPTSSVRMRAALEGFLFDAVDAGLWCEDARVLLVEVEGHVDGVEVYSSQ